MSADNWAMCPRCEKRREEFFNQKDAETAALYGNVPVEEFDKARAELAEPTFREDYEIVGAEDGEVKVRYRGSCSVCNLRLSFSHDHPLDVDGAS